MAIRMTSHMTRRAFGATAGTLLLSTKLVAQTEKTETPLLSRPIPGNGERIPAVGLGTAYVFDVNNEVTRRNADAVIKALTMNGGRRLAQFDSGELLQAASSSPALSLRGLSIKASIIIKGK